MIDAGELALLRESHEHATIVKVIVNGCAYSCCGRGWLRRDGYEQQYVGRIASVGDEGFLLYRLGIGTLTYALAARFDEVESVSRDRT